jgi:glycosyltransferase involved in cell wall biosynthesis
LGQPATYAAAVTQILDNPDFASRLASQARDRLEREFTAVTMVRQLEQMYREMMASRKSRKVAQDALIPNQMPHSQAE